MSGLSTLSELREFFCRTLPERARSQLTGLGDSTSAGSLGVCFEPPLPSFSLRLAAGTLAVTEGIAADAVACLTTSPESLAALVARAPNVDTAPSGTAPPELVARLLRLDAERAARLRDWQGRIVLVLTDAETVHRFELCSVLSDATEGRTPCVLRLSLDDAAALASGRLAPLQVMMSGQLVMEGDAQSVMELLSVLGG